MSNGYWETLGIEATQDQKQIRRAYARQLRAVHPEDDPEGFKRLREAYEMALWLASLPREALQVPEEAPEGTVVSPSQGVHTQPSFDTFAPTQPDEMAWESFTRILFADPPASEDQLIAAFDSLLDSLELENLALRARAEARAAELLGTAGSRADALLPHAIERFGWEAQQHSHFDHSAIGRILARAAGLKFLASIRQPGHEWSKALALLSVPPELRRNRLAMVKWGAADLVAQLLGTLRAEHPALLDEVNADSLQWWDEYLDRPRFPLEMLPWVALIGFVAAMLGACVENPAWMRVWVGLGVGAGAIGGCIALLCAKLYVFDAPRARWGHRWRFAGFWPSCGWAPIALVLVVAAGALPRSSLAILLVTPLALAVVWWMYLVRSPGMGWRGWNAVEWSSLLYWGFLIAWWVTSMKAIGPNGSTAPTLAAIAATTVYHAGTASLNARWSAVGAQAQRFFVVLLMLSLIAAGIPLCIDPVQFFSSALGPSAVLCIVLLHTLFSIEVQGGFGRGAGILGWLVFVGIRGLLSDHIPDTMQIATVLTFLLLMFSMLKSILWFRQQEPPARWEFGG